MRRILLILLLLVTLITACVVPANPPPGGSQPAEVPSLLTPVPGSAFNKLFPKAEGGFDLVYTQEKEGFAQAKLEKDGQEVATLSISDTATNPDAVSKYQQSREKIAGYPAVEVGNLGTGILVADRFQVQVRSKDDTFTQSDRAAWIARFDLDGLARLP
jgi:hypothetical protein